MKATTKHLLLTLVALVATGGLTFAVFKDHDHRHTADGYVNKGESKALFALWNRTGATADLKATFQDGTTRWFVIKSGEENIAVVPAGTLALERYNGGQVIESHTIKATPRSAFNFEINSQRIIWR